MRIKGIIYNTKPNATVRYCVGDYLNEMNRVYTEKYRVKYEELSTQRERENERWTNEVRRGWSDIRQKTADEQHHRDTLGKLSEAFNRLQSDAKAELNEILEEADRRFERHARPTGDKVDLATVELLKSGILSDDDFPKLVNDFRGNVAMTKIIGKYAQERASQSQTIEAKGALSRLALECEKKHFNYRAPLAEFAAMCEKALGDSSRTSRHEISPNAFHKVLTDSFAESFNEVKDLYVSEDFKVTDNA